MSLGIRPAPRTGPATARPGHRGGTQLDALVESSSGAAHVWQPLGSTHLGTVPEASSDAEQGLVGLHVMHRRL